MSVPHIKNLFLHFRFSLLHSPPAALPPPEGGERWRWENLPTQPLWESRVLRRARWSDRRANGKKRGETAEQKLERTEDERKVQLPAVCPGRLSSADRRTFRRWRHHNLQPWTQTPGQILTTPSHTHTHICTTSVSWSWNTQIIDELTAVKNAKNNSVSTPNSASQQHLDPAAPDVLQLSVFITSLKLKFVRLLICASHSADQTHNPDKWVLKNSTSSL